MYNIHCIFTRIITLNRLYTFYNSCDDQRTFFAILIHLNSLRRKFLQTKFCFTMHASYWTNLSIYLLSMLSLKVLKLQFDINDHTNPHTRGCHRYRSIFLGPRGPHGIPLSVSLLFSPQEKFGLHIYRHICLMNHLKTHQTNLMVSWDPIDAPLATE